MLSTSLEDTHRFGKALGALLQVGDFVALSGELGAGKTHFAKGVADGLGIDPTDVSSPTYSIIQSYSGRVPFHHADLYRLSGDGDLFAIGFFDLEGAFLVEWAEKAPAALPDERLEVQLTATDDSRRELTVKAFGARHQSLLAAWLAAL